MDPDFLRDLFDGIGPVSIRRMFGGYGIYQDGVIFAVVLRDRLLLKGDADIAGAYEAAGMVRWQYVGRHGRPVAMPYWQAPESAMDDPDEMTALARSALEAARRSGGRAKT